MTSGWIKRTSCNRIVAKIIVEAHRSVTREDIRRYISGAGFSPTIGRLDAVVRVLRYDYNWEYWSPAKGVSGYHAPDMSGEEEKAARLALGFASPTKQWLDPLPGLGWQELTDYIHRAAKVCGVVRGFAWEYFNEPF